MNSGLCHYFSIDQRRIVVFLQIANFHVYFQKFPSSPLSYYRAQWCERERESDARALSNSPSIPAGCCFRPRVAVVRRVSLKYKHPLRLDALACPPDSSHFHQLCPRRAHASSISIPLFSLQAFQNTGYSTISGITAISKPGFRPCPSTLKRAPYFGYLLVFTNLQNSTLYVNSMYRFTKGKLHTKIK